MSGLECSEICTRKLRFFVLARGNTIQTMCELRNYFKHSEMPRTHYSKMDGSVMGGMVDGQ